MVNVSDKSTPSGMVRRTLPKASRTVLLEGLTLMSQVLSCCSSYSLVMNASVSLPNVSVMAITNVLSAPISRFQGSVRKRMLAVEPISNPDISGDALWSSGSMQGQGPVAWRHQR